mmetsp:Transcript_58697/g.108274  ORF Transcript_58697/g.108274 Transcript_58697/m.108274 type:complete len:276 (+) Transcript_58697:1739-2566(+)
MLASSGAPALLFGGGCVLFFAASDLKSACEALRLTGGLEASSSRRGEGLRGTLTEAGSFFGEATTPLDGCLADLSASTPEPEDFCVPCGSGCWEASRDSAVPAPVPAHLASPTSATLKALPRDGVATEQGLLPGGTVPLAYLLTTCGAWRVMTLVRPRVGACPGKMDGHAAVGMLDRDMLPTESTDECPWLASGTGGDTAPLLCVPVSTGTCTAGGCSTEETPALVGANDGATCMAHGAPVGACPRRTTFTGCAVTCTCFMSGSCTCGGAAGRAS